ncbi:MAG TPA: rhomboid family intramembrane serine protease [Flavisolibacter sp.]|jgi:membrane associated rhomboid family serine protease|nr:rhomboid family intramembrane serine protease [Flavisolibacter sp.]
MFLPIGDDNRDRKITPVVNYLMIAVNVIVFIVFQHWGTDIHFTYAYSTVPAEILSGQDVITHSRMLTDPLTGQSFEMPGLQRTDIPVYLTLLTSMFMHGGIAHLLGNMLYLLICGDNIEDALGHFNYLIFYLLCGVLAGLSHVFATAFFGQSLIIPSLGASGAISGVLGGYLLLFPRKHIHLWLFLFFTISVPAFIAVGLWFVFQVINGLGILGGEEAGGIAYAAHIGGFIAGLILVKLFMPRKPPLIKERKSFW